MIRDRIAKFYRDHTTGCNIFVAGLVSGIVVTNKIDNRRLKVTSADIWQRQDGVQVMSINHRNGSTSTLKYNPTV